MAIGLAALGLLAFLLGCSGTFAEPPNSEPAAKCSLTGRWVNEKGSKIVISPSNNAGVFSGSYLTAVAATDTTIRPSSLQGIQHLEPQPTFGFLVKWSFSASTAVFVGQCFLDENGEEQLKTTWLLRGKVGSAAEDWKATRVGTDTFYRIK
ncbi:avidin-like [Protobothrops mucrosquamatus]|uniref:avidin-like n=1 Tax=Protobothrops mucrosquamatus TaxID=103944 RepID=UPI0007757B78|nr:avidin-like [Protobothrops mucrosquamatus]